MKSYTLEGLCSAIEQNHAVLNNYQNKYYSSMQKKLI